MTLGDHVRSVADVFLDSDSDEPSALLLSRHKLLRPVGGSGGSGGAAAAATGAPPAAAAAAQTDAEAISSLLPAPAMLRPPLMATRPKPSSLSVVGRGCILACLRRGHCVRPTPMHAVMATTASITVGTTSHRAPVAVPRPCSQL